MVMVMQASRETRERAISAALRGQRFCGEGGEPSLTISAPLAERLAALALAAVEAADKGEAGRRLATLRERAAGMRRDLAAHTNLKEAGRPL